MALGIGFGSGGITSGPSDTPDEDRGPGRHGTENGLGPYGIAANAKAARDRALFAGQQDRFQGMHSAAKHELRGDGLGPAANTGLIRNARQGLLGDLSGVRSDLSRDPAGMRDALGTLQDDFSGVREARTALDAARGGGDPSALQDARQDFRGARHMAMAGERRGMSQAELQTQRPNLYNRLQSRGMGRGR